MKTHIACGGSKGIRRRVVEMKHGADWAAQPNPRGQHQSCRGENICRIQPEKNRQAKTIRKERKSLGERRQKGRGSWGNNESVVKVSVEQRRPRTFDDQRTTDNE